ncbi:SDR family oxidoreductase [Roseomonas sp. NAR14]|uniref:SDR family oxidoreductase n=1 Tax=Roseomonas acroporae TaxID=2937791 RepID=A0A9X1YC35_9PROT|nr:SDR family oxidoreductase [Roseomonas acroporae]MCK8786443.1 SDR family oxidoreductase [Roseomonas acroporae]
MQIDLSGRRAVVTGSTGGIGFAIARALAECGAAVVLNGRGEERTASAVARLREAVPGATAEGVSGDLGTAEGCAAFLGRAGEADILVNNLGIFAPKPFLEIDDAEWHRFLEVNLMSGVRLSRHYLPRMAKAGWGRIVFLSSESALNIPREMIHYGVTKTALLALSRGLAESVPASGVTVNAVLPGPTRSEGVAEFIDQLSGERHLAPEEAEKVFLAENRPTSLLGRLATVKEVANMVAYVCSPLASATTGAALRVDGGVVRTISP